MSYILKALRLSEEERAKGEVPRLTTRHERRAPPPRKLWPWMVVAAVVFLALMVFFAMWPTQIASRGKGVEPDDSVRAAGDPPQAPPVNGRQAGSEPPPHDPRLQDIEALPPSGPALDVRAAAGDATSVQEARLPEQPAVNWLDEAEEARPRAPPTPARRDAEPKPVSPVHREIAAANFADQSLLDWAVDVVLAEQDPEYGEPVDLALAVPEPAAPEPQPDSEPSVDAYGDVPQLWQLPHAIRSGVPKVDLSVHVYAPEDSSRFVIINRKRYREGDVVNGGVVLEAIIPSGVVLAYEGHRFRLGSQ